MLQRNLLYTAITRGKKLVVLVGTKKALGMAVRRVDTGQRHTTLRKRLQATERMGEGRLRDRVKRRPKELLSAAWLLTVASAARESAAKVDAAPRRLAQALLSPGGVAASLPLTSPPRRRCALVSEIAPWPHATRCTKCRSARGAPCLQLSPVQPTLCRQNFAEFDFAQGAVWIKFFSLGTTIFGRLPAGSVLALKVPPIERRAGFPRHLDVSA